MIKKICIVGSGFTGTLVAAELLERTKHEIILVDLDNLNHEFQINEQSFNYYPFKKFSDVLTFSLGFGGSTNLWHGVMTDFDLLDKKRLSDNFGLENLCKSKMTNLAYKLFPGIEKILFNNEEKTNHKIWQKKSYYVPKKPFRFRKKLRELKKKFTSKLTVFNNTVAIDLDIKLDQNLVKAISLNVISDNKINKIEADFFISSLGALETPRFLKQSFDKENIHLANCGSNLLDHPFASIGNILFNRKIFSKHGHPGLFSNFKKREGLSPVKLINNRNSSINLIPNIMSIKDSFTNLKSGDKEKLFKLSAASVPFTTKLIFNFVRTDSFKLICHHEALKTDGGSIKIIDKKDKFGRRISKYSYPSTLSFFDTIDEIKSMNLLHQFYDDVKKIDIFDNKSNIDILPASHYAGTCFASKYHNDSVCDQNFKVRNVQNIYIADASVLPIIGNSNLSFTLCKVAKIVADNFVNL